MIEFDSSQNNRIQIEFQTIKLQLELIQTLLKTGRQFQQMNSTTYCVQRTIGRVKMDSRLTDQNALLRRESLEVRAGGSSNMTCSVHASFCSKIRIQYNYQPTTGHGGNWIRTFSSLEVSITDTRHVTAD
jgi:hypothetical protein